jgi:hypothetical protein
MHKTLLTGIKAQYVHTAGVARFQTIGILESRTPQRWRLTKTEIESVCKRDRDRMACIYLSTDILEIKQGFFFRMIRVTRDLKASRHKKTKDNTRYRYWIDSSEPLAWQPRAYHHL